MDILWVNLSILYNLFNLDYYTFGCCCHVSIEVSFGLLKLKISKLVSPFGLHDGIISKERRFEDVFFAIEDSCLTRFRRHKYSRFDFSLFNFL